MSIPALGIRAFSSLTACPINYTNSPQVMVVMRQSRSDLESQHARFNTAQAIGGTYS